MGIFKKFQSIFHEDWCPKCQIPMDKMQKQLYMLPMMVGHYVSHKDATYYINHLCKVNRKSEIPSGAYACGIISYRCPSCSHGIVRLSIFLPVRDQEKLEEIIDYENGELDEFLRNSNYE